MAHRPRAAGNEIKVLSRQQRKELLPMQPQRPLVRQPNLQHLQASQQAQQLPRQHTPQQAQLVKGRRQTLPSMVEADLSKEGRSRSTTPNSMHLLRHNGKENMTRTAADATVKQHKTQPNVAQQVKPKAAGARPRRPAITADEDMPKRSLVSVRNALEMEMETYVMKVHQDELLYDPAMGLCNNAVTPRSASLAHPPCASVVLSGARREDPAVACQPTAIGPGLAPIALFSAPEARQSQSEALPQAPAVAMVAPPRPSSEDPPLALVKKGVCEVAVVGSVSTPRAADTPSQKRCGSQRSDSVERGRQSVHQEASTGHNAAAADFRGKAAGIIGVRATRRTTACYNSAGRTQLAVTPSDVGAAHPCWLQTDRPGLKADIPDAI
eukprot:CAMPEP_0117461642 /NCGR_PEP_ID=MMETSP0784-20121206/2634_1 /TAXON_ID=39447 /ORGANISM="" /LENGTH=381 /DNA_ID=CAMNT_0005255363 /DNA_START=77 /DNA_END=1221 /DNA_ORIENTATION=+